MSLGFALLGSVTATVMYVMISRFQGAVREPTTIMERVVVTGANVSAVLVCISGAVRISHEYRGGSGFMWAFLVVGVLCPLVDRQKRRLRSIVDRAHLRH